MSGILFEFLVINCDDGYELLNTDPVPALELLSNPDNSPGWQAYFSHPTDKGTEM